MLIRPLPGADRRGLVARLRQDAETLTAIGRPRRTSLDLYNEYIAWAHDAVAAMSGKITDSDIDGLILTRRYWLLQSLPRESSLLRPTVELEVAERIRVIEAARAALTAEIQRWASDTLVAVADTSVYINAPELLENFPATAYLDDTRGEDIRLVVPMLVVDELDGLKRSKGESRGRAHVTLATLDRLLGDPKYPLATLHEAQPMVTGPVPAGKLTIELLHDPPGHARLPLADDEIVDRAVALQTLVDTRVRLVTFDTGQAMRARQAGLRVTKLDRAPQP